MPDVRVCPQCMIPQAPDQFVWRGKRSGHCLRCRLERQIAQRRAAIEKIDAARAERQCAYRDRERARNA